MKITMFIFNAFDNGVANATPLFFPKQKQSGFTLIELMIVVAIIGILSAIAIPQFSSYREKAFNATALQDLRNIMVAEEAEFATNQSYTSVPSGNGPAWIFGNSKFVSKGVGYIVNTSVGSEQFAVFSGHINGNKFYAGDYQGTLAFKTSTTPASDAKLETISILSGWGSPL